MIPPHQHLHGQKGEPGVWAVMSSNFLVDVLQQNTTTLSPVHTGTVVERKKPPETPKTPSPSLLSQASSSPLARTPIPSRSHPPSLSIARSLIHSLSLSLSVSPSLSFVAFYAHLWLCVRSEAKGDRPERRCDGEGGDVGSPAAEK